MMEKKLYGVQIVLRHSVYNHGTVLEQKYEEMVLAVKAKDSDEAFAKAEKYAGRYCDDEHENPYGETVKTEIAAVLDCFEAFDEEDGVTELYSKVYSDEGKPCGPDELFSLRYKEFNAPMER